MTVRPPFAWLAHRAVCFGALVPMFTCCASNACTACVSPMLVSPPARGTRRALGFFYKPYCGAECPWRAITAIRAACRASSSRIVAIFSHVAEEGLAGNLASFVGVALAWQTERTVGDLGSTTSIAVRPYRAGLTRRLRRGSNLAAPLSDRTLVALILARQTRGTTVPSRGARIARRGLGSVRCGDAVGAHSTRRRFTGRLARLVGVLGTRPAGVAFRGLEGPT